MEEMRDRTAQDLRKHKLEGDNTLLENFVKAGTPDLSNPETTITPAAILGNIFIFILAGHETSANNFTLAVTLLACNPAFQKTLQADIDSQLGTRPPGQWFYREDYTRLMQGRVGALMKETLRLYSVLPFIPKMNKDKEQTLKVGNQFHVLPANTLVLINISATHRNPKYWPKIEKLGGDGPPYPLSDFNPERWIQPPGSPNTYNPPEGAYIPFAEGHRSCMGKRFAEVEFCAAIARLFSEYSVELACGPGETFEDALSNAKQLLSRDMGFEMGLKITRPVPLKLLRREP